MVLTNTIHRDRDFQGVVNIHSEEIEEIVKWYYHSKSGPNRGNSNLTACGLMWYNKNSKHNNNNNIKQI
jgi:hypothetical protein